MFDKSLAGMANDILPDGWEAENEAVLICPHGHRTEWDGGCPEGCTSPLKGMGLI